MKNWIHQLFTACFLLFVCTLAFGANYTYEKKQIGNQVIHIVTIDPAAYRAALVKANHGVGRATVPEIAKQVNADIAINAGYFKIDSDKSKDGKPSGTLIINGKAYQVKNYKQALIVITHGKLEITQANPKQLMTADSSIVSGIPLLIYDGNISRDITGKTSNFYIKRHARTAVGVKADGHVVIVVAEQGVAKTNGLTMPDLANLMKSLHCQYAINLDGGGSSTLYLNGKLVNLTIGDKDESNGLSVIRPVSDAIVFHKMRSHKMGSNLQL